MPCSVPWRTSVDKVMTYHKSAHAGTRHVIRLVQTGGGRSRGCPPLKDAVQDLEMLRPVHGADLLRAKALETDMSKIFGDAWLEAYKPIVAGSVATQNYLRSFKTDCCEPAHILAHHFLQYNAVLSGG
eukprot:3382722-Amphidinium_carterae.1